MKNVRRPPLNYLSASRPTERIGDCMPRSCTICLHAECDAVDRALVSGEPYRRIAKRFALSPDAVYRHKVGHLPATLTKAQDAVEIARADSLIEQVRDLQGRTMAILVQAERSGDLRIALQAVGQARGNLELLAKLLGELQEQQTTVQVLVASPEWLRLRMAITRALEPYPDARAAVAQAVNDVGG